jgi:hypothetical protein
LALSGWEVQVRAEYGAGTGRRDENSDPNLMGFN